MASFQHPELGNLRGVTKGSTTQFLGLQYGILEHKLADSKVASGDASNTIDATRYGPSAIGPPNGIDLEFQFIQSSLAKPESPGLSGTDGLNLNITVPGSASAISSENKFPVFVFIHGGGFALGANWWPQSDLSRLVSLSQEKGLPIIAININYRLGLSGFLFSEELAAAGIQANRGLRDQRTALKWIGKYIRGFGGDPDNITVAGESAGSVSVAYLLCSEEQLAKRLMCMGGSPPLLRPLPRVAADGIYGSVLKILGIEGQQASDRIRALLEYPDESILQKLATGPPLLPVSDGDLIVGTPTFESIKSMEHFDVYPMPGKRKYSSLLVGDCGFDGSIFLSMLFQRMSGIAKAFEESIRGAFSSSPSTADLILQLYEIAETGISDHEAFLRIARFGNDICFFVPTASMAHGFPGDTYLYAFNEPNPWDGPFKGYASHILDIAFLFQNYNEQLTPEQQETAVSFASHVISYVNGQKPWPVFTDENPGSMIYGSNNGKAAYTTDLTEDKTGRTGKIFQVSQDVGLDALLDAWDGFLAGH